MLLVLAVFFPAVTSAKVCCEKGQLLFHNLKNPLSYIFVNDMQDYTQSGLPFVHNVGIMRLEFILIIPHKSCINNSINQSKYYV